MIDVRLKSPVFYPNLMNMSQIGHVRNSLNHILEKCFCIGKIMQFVIYCCYNGGFLILELSPVYFIYN